MIGLSIELDHDVYRCENEDCNELMFEQDIHSLCVPDGPDDSITYNVCPDCYIEKTSSIGGGSWEL